MSILDLSCTRSVPSDCRRLFSMSRTLLRAVSTFGVIRVAAFRGSSVLQQRCYTPGSALNVTVEHLQDEHTGVSVIAFNRPEALNAMSRKFVSEFDDALGSLRFNRNVRVIILRSVVPGIFCAGADLKERKTIPPEDVGPLVAKGRRIIGDLSSMPMPVITALDGGAYGGGLEMALATDIRIAADSAKMGLTETRLAIIPGGGGTQRLPRLVGIGKAKELIYSAKVVSGTEAADIGLAEHVVPQNENSDAAYQRALQLATEIATKGPIAISMAKLAIDNGMQTDISTALKVEESCYAQVIPTKDRLEALKAFMEKRTPLFQGK